jgi:hypothetical protein
LRDTSNGPVARLTIRTSSRGESWMLTLRTDPSHRNSRHRGAYAARERSVSAQEEFLHHRSYETIPSRDASLR